MSAAVLNYNPDDPAVIMDPAEDWTDHDPQVELQVAADVGDRVRFDVVGSVRAYRDFGIYVDDTLVRRASGFTHGMPWARTLVTQVASGDVDGGQVTARLMVKSYGSSSSSPSDIVTRLRQVIVTNLTSGGDSLGGSVTIEDPDTDAVVSHGLPRTPAEWEVGLRPLDAEAAAADWWLSDHGPFTFQVNLADAPTTEAKFGWLWTPADAAIPPDFLVVDDFEDGVGHYSGDSGWSQASDEVFAGDFSFKHATSANTSLWRGAISGFENTFTRGHTLEARFRVSSSASSVFSSTTYRILWATSSASSPTSNGFRLDIDPRNLRLALFRHTSGAGTLLDEQTGMSLLDFPQDEWCRIVIEWLANGDITCEYRDESDDLIASVSANDTSHGSNHGIGFGVNSGSSGTRTFWWDELRLIDGL